MGVAGDMEVGEEATRAILMWDEVTRQCPQTTTFEEKGEPKQIRTEVPLLTTKRNRLTPPQVPVCYVI